MRRLTFALARLRGHAGRIRPIAPSYSASIWVRARIASLMDAPQLRGSCLTSMFPNVMASLHLSRLCPPGVALEFWQRPEQGNRLGSWMG